MSRASLAREKGVSRAAVSLACAEGGPLAESVVGTQINADDPPVIAWLAEPVRGPESRFTPMGDETPSEPSTVVAPTKAEMLQLSKRKREAEARRLELANAATEGKIISRELVAVHMIGLVERAFKRLLGDATKSIAARVTSSARGGGTIEEAIRITRGEIEKQLLQVKVGLKRMLAQRSALAARVPAPPTKSRKPRRRK